MRLGLFLGCFIDLFFIYYNFLVYGFLNSFLFYCFVKFF